jgi:hypothetical protein
MAQAGQLRFLGDGDLSSSEQQIVVAVTPIRRVLNHKRLSAQSFVVFWALWIRARDSNYPESHTQ